MASTRLAYVPYGRLDGRPNVVVDGSPTAGTVLTLTHWPGYPAPAGLARDLSAQMAFAYLDAGGGLGGATASPDADAGAGAEAVSNNHFDQDGLVGLLALTRPEEAVARQALLEDLAGAGDFATYRDRRAARLSMAVAAYADPERSPLALEEADAERTAQLYEELLALLPAWCDDPDAVRGLWADEDAHLAASEEQVRAGAIAVEEHPEADLAVFTVPATARYPHDAHRFAHQRAPGPHPMALANATQRAVILVNHGARYRLHHRYETWVAYQSRRPRARRPLGPLAERLSAREPGRVAWTGERSAALEPVLRPGGEGASDLAPGEVVATVAGYLATAEPDWDPYRPR